MNSNTPHPSPWGARGQDSISLALMVCSLFAIMVFGMLPGLLAGLAGYALTRWTQSRFLRGHRLLAAYGGVIAASIVVAGPLLVLTIAGVELSKFLSLAAQNYSSLMSHLVTVALDWRARLPEGLSALIPASSEEIRDMLKATLQSNVPTLAGVGKTWATGLMLVVIGIIVGALVAIDTSAPSQTKFGQAFRTRGAALAKTFTSIVVAQFWIAAINACLTALFLFVLLPFFGNVRIPYSAWLVLLTFVAGMLPIVGNLLCNVVLTLAGLGVGPHIAVACLVFLVAIHKLEYFINAKVVGATTKTAAWELILAMFVFEAIFGVGGLVAAPLVFAYVKSELRGIGVI